VETNRLEEHGVMAEHSSSWDIRRAGRPSTGSHGRAATSSAPCDSSTSCGRDDGCE